MRNLKIAFCLRGNYRSAPGGDTVQMRSYLKILRSLNNTVTLFAGSVSEDELRDADAVFIWHLERLHESFQPWLTATHLGKPVFLVPTCWHRPEEWGLRFVLREQLKLWCRLLIRRGDPAARAMRFRHWGSCRKRLLTGSERLLVNSESEKKLLIGEGAPPERLMVLPNVVNPQEIGCVTKKIWSERTGSVCVGHFCPRKNQLGLIRALRGSGLRVTFIGAARPMHRAYFERCRIEAAGAHDFPGALSHDEVLRRLGGCRLCVSASVAETPGICNLEAAALGCNLLLPDLEPIREYFGDRAHYLTEHRMAEAMCAAVSEPPAPTLAEDVMCHYTEDVLPAFFAGLDLCNEDYHVDFA